MNTPDDGMLCFDQPSPCCDQRSETQKAIDADPTTNPAKEYFKTHVVKGRTIVGSEFNATIADPYRVALRIHNSINSFDPITVLVHKSEPPFATVALENLAQGETLNFNQPCDKRFMQEEMCILSGGVSIVATTEVIDTTGEGKC